MKKLLDIFTAAALAALLLNACQSKDPFPTAGGDDAPRILNTDIPEGKGGEPAQLMSISRTTPFTFSVIVTPAKYTTVTWNIDGEDVFEGLKIDMPLPAGVHWVKLTAKTAKGLSTTRDFTVAVSPLDGDPVTAEAQVLAAPGQNATISGSNMDAVKKVFLDNTEVEMVASDANSLTIELPASLEAGVYSVYFENAAEETLAAVYKSGDNYQAFTIGASADPLVSAALISAKPAGNVTLEGINLDKVQSLTVGGQNAPIVSQSYSQLVFTCPDLAKGEYEISGVDNSGKAVSFAGAESGLVKVTREVVLWEGSHVVTWGTPFNALKDQFASLVSAGTIVRGYVNGNGQGCLATSWWNNIYTGESDPNRGDQVINGEMVLEYTLTEKSIELMNTQDGLLFVGDGYTLTKVTKEE